MRCRLRHSADIATVPPDVRFRRDSGHAESQRRPSVLPFSREGRNRTQLSALPLRSVTGLGSEPMPIILWLLGVPLGLVIVLFLLGVV
jgi:hypothetical protein